jgi:hypothetical protein
MKKKLCKKGLSGCIGLTMAIGIWLVLAAGIAGPWSETAFAQGDQASQYPPNWQPIIYPNKGQNAQQQEMDKYQCYNWAKQNSGFDPMAPIQPTAPPPPPQAAQGGAGKGAAAGALGGLAIGSLYGQAGKGAAAGAMAGGLMGGMRRREQMQRMAVEQEQYARQQQAAYNQKRNTYNRAFSACMEGKGYTVK